MICHYVLVDGEPRLEPDFIAWAQWFETAERTLARSELDDVIVSTVFLGLDHSYGDGPPILWETMIFGGELHEYQQRHRNRADALAGHREAVLQAFAAQELTRRLLDAPAAPCPPGSTNTPAGDTGTPSA